MKTVFSTKLVHPRDKFDFWHSVACKTVVDHDSHSLEWAKRKNDVRDWGKGQKSWEHVAHAPVVVGHKAWVGFNVSILKGVLRLRLQR